MCMLACLFNDDPHAWKHGFILQQALDPDWVEQSTAMSSAITSGYLLSYVQLDTASYGL